MSIYSETISTNSIVHQEYINLNLNLTDYNAYIKDILYLSTNISIIKNYSYISLVTDGVNLTYDYKLKLYVKIIYSLEYNEDHLPGDVQYLTFEKPLIINAPLPKGYKNGMNLTITPKIIDENYNLIDNTIYLSNFFSIYISL